jgi:serine/threonine protein kinase
LEVIGKGGSSIVYRATDSQGNEFAVKVIDPTKAYHPEFAANMVAKEFYNLKQVEGHPNILRAFDYDIIEKAEANTETYTMYQVLEFAPNGPLSSFVKYGPLPEEICRFFMTQILYAVKHMHDSEYAHMDLKLNNILLDEFYNIKVADLGSSH